MLGGSSMDKLRVGLIGLGNVAQAHLEAYKTVDKIDVVAGAKLRPERLREIEKKWNIKVYTDYVEMLEKEKLHIACVLTPAASHRAVIEKVAEAGVHVLCEKPMAVRMDDAKAIIDVCKESGVQLCYGATWRFLPACRKAKQIIQSGKLGRIMLLTESFIGGQGFESFRDAGSQHYPVGGPGGGSMGLVDHGIHLIDMLMWLTESRVESVFGHGNYSGQIPGTEYLTMHLENGAVCILIYNEATYSCELPNEGIFSWGGSWDINYNLTLGGGWDEQPQNIRVYGTEGALRIFHYANKMFISSRGKQKQVPVLDKPMPGNFALQMESFVNAIEAGKPPEVTGEDGLKALQVLLAAYESAKTQSSVKIKSRPF